MKITFVQSDKEQREADRVITNGLSLRKAKVGTWIMPPAHSSDGKFTVRDVLNLMDHEVWVRVRVHDGRDENPAGDLVLWSADWIGGGVDDFFVPKELKDYLDWDADDLSIEVHPTGRQKPTPMIVVHAYQYGAEEPA